MSKFQCRCGNVISDTTDWHPETFALQSSRFRAEIDLSDQEIDAYLEKLKDLNPPLPRREAVYDLLSVKYLEASRDVMICKDCGRVWLQDLSKPDDRGCYNHFISYVCEEKD